MFSGRFDDQSYEARQTGQDSGAYGKGFSQPRIGKRQADDRSGGEQAHCHGQQE
ncbi:hypothetical protein GCM10009578_065170 [Streptomyces rhizosphaericus]